MIRFVAAVFCMLLLAGPAQGEVFKWTDENGKTHFTDDIGNIPEKALDKSEAIRMGRPGGDEEISPKGRADSDALDPADRKQRDCLRRCAARKYVGRICKQRCGVGEGYGAGLE